ncbi:MAG: VWA domain-containing protein, partial [Bryobacteraceae bacterium]
MKAFVFLTAMALCSPAVHAQQGVAPVTQKPVESVEDPGTRIILDVTRVNMLFTVTDKKGRFVTDLGRDDFQVFENKNPQTIAEFTAETDLPLRLGILIDTSNSIRERFKFEQEAANSFITSVVRPGHDKAMVVSFDTSAELVADLIDDTEKLQNAIRSLRPGGGTALFDAIYFACRDKLAKDQP